MKKILILLITMMSYFIFADETTDVIKKEDQKQKKDIIKYRGNVMLNFRYKFGVLDGISKNHISGVNYTVLDLTDEDNSSHTEGLNGRIIGSKNGGFGANLSVNYNIIVPFYIANNPLLTKNNFTISFNSNLGISNFSTGTSLSFSPISIYDFTVGFLIATNWRYRSGGGFNKIVDDELEPINGPVIRIYFKNTLQFSLDNYMPKKYKRWTGVYTTNSIEFQYYDILTVSEETPYQGGGKKENYDGWRLIANFKLGYKIPIIQGKNNQNGQFLKINNIKFVIHKGAFFTINYINLTHFLDSQMKDDGWGSDFIYIAFGPYLRFDLPYNLFCNISLQIKNDKKYSCETVGNLDFQTREYEDWYLYLDSLQFNFGWRF